jgi:hypothetical protein
LEYEADEDEPPKDEPEEHAADDVGQALGTVSSEVERRKRKGERKNKQAKPAPEPVYVIRNGRLSHVRYTKKGEVTYSTVDEARSAYARNSGLDPERRYWVYERDIEQKDLPAKDYVIFEEAVAQAVQSCADELSEIKEDLERLRESLEKGASHYFNQD